jgi:hypothetical protein
VLGNNFFGLKYLNSLMRIRDPGWKKFGFWIRDGKKKSDPGAGKNIPDPQHWSYDESVWQSLTPIFASLPK